MIINIPNNYYYKFFDENIFALKNYLFECNFTWFPWRCKRLISNQDIKIISSVIHMNKKFISNEKQHISGKAISVKTIIDPKLTFTITDKTSIKEYYRFSYTC